jgi:ubiquinone/menaquinone biosynthesis C-methylase UbiE
MSFYRDRIYTHLVSTLGNPRPIRDIRQRIIPLAQGRVLEIGVGSGANFPHYDPAKVSKVFALEPNPGMIRLAEQQRRGTSLDVEFLGLPGESIPLGNGAVDTVVSTFTLCTVPGVTQAIRGLERVLRLGGKFIFFELGLSPDTRVQRWQRWSEPIAHWLFEGLHVTRDIPSLITQCGFKIEQIEAAYIAPFPKSWSYCWWESRSREQVDSKLDPSSLIQREDCASTWIVSKSSGR